MKDPASGPFLFDTSAEVWLARTRDSAAARWFQEYRQQHPVHVSVVSVMERVRGYALLWQRYPPDVRMDIEAARIEYLGNLGTVWPVDIRIAVVAAEIMALIPHPPSPVKRRHGCAESPAERLARWRFDCVIAATALVLDMTLVHNNAEDFETIRGAIERSPLRFPKLGPLQLVRCNALA
jgi:predicted nucleic acid-binding protein